MNIILTPYTKNGFTLKNRLVMAPMTRSRAINNIPNDLMARYYGQRTGAGLIITEGTAPSPEALGYARIPGIYSQAQTDGWKKITTAVHNDGTKIFLQIMHTGRIGHNDNLPEGAVIRGVSAIRAAGQIFTDKAGMQDHSAPIALTAADIKAVIAAHVTAAKNAVEAGFDGIELHGANGYLIEQFLNPHINNRTDEYGGSMENRVSVVLELVNSIAAAIGKEKTGIRLSPYSVLCDLAPYAPEEVHSTYTYLATALNKIGIAYMHVGVAAGASPNTIQEMRKAFKGTFILCNGLNPVSAQEALNNDQADLVAFGRAFLANPDLDRRIADETSLNEPDFSTAYTPGERGYTDYPVLVALDQ